MVALVGLCERRQMTLRRCGLGICGCNASMRGRMSVVYCPHGARQQRAKQGQYKYLALADDHELQLKSDAGKEHAIHSGCDAKRQMSKRERESTTFITSWHKGTTPTSLLPGRRRLATALRRES
jgi:hypothetical protein